MDRQIVYALAIPYETDFLSAQRFMQEALGLLAQDILGTATVVSGLACGPNSPPALSVVVQPGRLYQQTALDATAYGTITGGNPAGGLAADTNPNHQVLKQGLLRDPVTLACAAPGTTGTSVNYLIEASFLETDTTASVLNFFNTANPAAPLTGPGGNGLTLPTIRACQVQLLAKAGTPAATGTQTTPAADAGWVGLYVVTVAFGQTAITAGNISVAPGAPFITATLPQLATLSSTGYLVDTSATANAIVCNPAIALTGYTVGTTFRIKPANANTGPVTAQISGLATISLQRPDGSLCVPNDVRVTKDFDVVVETGPVLKMLSWPQVGDGPKVVLTGAAHAYVTADAGNANWRSNSGSPMVDTLPGATGGALPAGWSSTIINTDSAGLLAIQVGAGSTLTGSNASGGFLVLGPGQKVTIQCDGTNYQAWGAPPRARLAANTTIYVATTGSDSANVGVTVGTPFATGSHAYAWAQSSLDLAEFQLTIAFAAGTSYAVPSCSGPIVGQNSPVVIQGAGSGSTTFPNGIAVAGGANIQATSINLATASSGGAAIAANDVGTKASVGSGIVFGASSGAHIEANTGALIYLASSYTISGGAAAHIVQQAGGIVDASAIITVTLSGTPNFSVAFADSVAGGVINFGSNVTFSGSATGSRYATLAGGVINTNGAGATYLPGNSAGSGSWYF
jgi:hypothetical protein